MNSSRTAIKRNSISRPLASILNQFDKRDLIFDYGCGWGDDILRLQMLGYNAYGYDPHHDRNDIRLVSDPIIKYSKVLVTYVLNTIDNYYERKDILRHAWDILQPGGTMFVSCRTKKEIEREAIKNNWEVYRDGYLTKTKTFQIGFDSNLFHEYSNELKDVESISFIENNFIMAMFKRTF
jgi:DNA phosphorothioation-associated putative methyltransferase